MIVIILGHITQPCDASGTKIIRFTFNSSQAGEVIFLLHCLLMLPYGLAAQRSVTSLVESRLCQTYNSVPNFLL